MVMIFMQLDSVPSPSSYSTPSTQQTSSPAPPPNTILAPSHGTPGLLALARLSPAPTATTTTTSSSTTSSNTNSAAFGRQTRRSRQHREGRGSGSGSASSSSKFRGLPSDEGGSSLIMAQYRYGQAAQQQQQASSSSASSQQPAYAGAASNQQASGRFSPAAARAPQYGQQLQMHQQQHSHQQQHHQAHLHLASSHLQQHQQHSQPGPSSSSSSSLQQRPVSPPSEEPSNGIIDVYASNLETELQHIRDAIERYPFVAMDTEFPGVVARPIGNFRSSSDYHYQTLRCNVDLLRIIQLGITLADEQGNLAEPVSTWQFNFRFSLDDDMYAPESIELLTNSGINFKKHEEYGIDVQTFGELLISSGLVLLDDVKWISFHSGYDFGYLLKLVSCAPLPSTETEFFELLKIWFPCIYDIKHLMRSCKSLKGGLQDVADELQVPRIGPQHQAGSDSLLTASTFFKMRSRFFEDDIDPKYLGTLYGLGNTSNQFHQAQASGSGSAVNASSTPQMQAVGMPTPGGLSLAAGPPIPPVASAALPIRDPFASPFKANSTPGVSMVDLPHAASPSPGSGLRGVGMAA